MKNTIISILAILFLGATIFIACSKEENSEIESINDPIVTSFLKSKTFLRAKDDLENYGTISYKEIKSGIIKHGELQISVIGIPILEDGEKIGLVEVVDLKTDKFLPNGDSYALNYINLKSFDLKSLTGSVEMTDMNYDNFTHSKIEVKNNLIKTWKYKPLPKVLLNKYSTIKNPNKLKSLQAKVMCDGNGNGNVSFGECYSCLNNAIDSNGFSEWVCDFPVAGWLSCWGTVSAACVYISATY